MQQISLDTSLLIPICQKYHVANVSLFGSFARGEADEASDIDLIVSFSGKMTLFRMAAMKRELSSTMGRDVDLVSEGAISPYLIERINNEKQVIYAA